MRFAEQVAEAINCTNGRALDDAVRAMWAGHGAGLIEDDEAQALAALAHARQSAGRAPRAPSQALGMHLSIFPVRRPQRPRNRAAALARRRRVAASGALPPALAALFTMGELAALAIIADEVRRRGRCELALDAIAARAGVSRSTTKNAIRAARQHGLILVTERPRPGRKNDTNTIRIVDRQWCAWLKGAKRRASDRGQNVRPHEYSCPTGDGSGQAGAARFGLCQNRARLNEGSNRHAARQRRAPSDAR